MGPGGQGTGSIYTRILEFYRKGPAHPLPSPSERPSTWGPKVSGRFRARLTQTGPKPTRNFETSVLEPKMSSSDRPDPTVPDSIRSDPTYAAQRDLICNPHLSEPSKCEIEEDFRSDPTRPDRPQPDPIRPDRIYKAQLNLTCTPLLSERWGILVAMHLKL